MFEAINLVASGAKSTSMPIITRSSKNLLPANLVAEAEKSKMSVLTPSAELLPILYQNYPDGSLLFPNNSDVAAKFNSMIQTIKKNPSVIEFFRKIHIKSLNSLYNYFMKIYTNFNLTNPGCTQDTENPIVDMAAYLNHEAMYATSKKKLIMNHFLNIIQAQFSQSIMSYSSSITPDVASALGKIFIANDYSVDLKTFTTPQTDIKIIAYQKICMDFLQQYVAFFQAYTNSLAVFDESGINQYYKMAQFIDDFLTPPADSKTVDKNFALKKMNPVMFFYDAESMRSIQFIPFVASTIPKNSQLIPWAPVIVDAAIKNKLSNGNPIAYFKDASGKTTKNEPQATSLYLLVTVGKSLFEEELLVQPGWLNSQDGCIRILRACLGDFSALVGMGILDSETEMVIQKTLPESQKTVAASSAAAPASSTTATPPTVKVKK